MATCKDNLHVREKLAELISVVQDHGYKTTHEECSVFIAMPRNEVLATHLIANNVTVQEWIPVTERLPEKGEEVLVFDTRENWICFAWLHHDETWTALGFDFPLDLGEVTHWMPLPAPPKGE